MAVTMAEITKLRNLTSAGLMDCKKALAETDGDIEAAVEILRKKGQAVAAKREDRQAAEGCVLSKNEGNYAAVVALNCETDFVAKNAGFVALTTKILDAAVANKVKSLDDLKALQLDGRSIADLIVEEVGKTGEKMEIGAFEYIEAPSTTSYNHQGNKLATICGFNLEGVEYQVGRDVAMQVASMNPVAVDRNAVPESIIESEKAVAIEKTKQEQVQKAVNAALSKAGINPAHVDSEAHIESNMSKGWITPEQAEQARKIIAEVGAQKAANLPEQMIENIVKGRINKYYKENCLVEQEFIKDGNLTVGQYLEQSAKGLTCISFKRVNLNQD
ncbi:MAG: translation elongation factor Ts [Muribaculaceae bacterium]|nr:translation elongation factor Ts [Muribaculaceae bacterium]MDE7336234.1 translation elongation factor Ts [Muribaculaceae bacterium]